VIAKIEIETLSTLYAINRPSVCHTGGSVNKKAVLPQGNRAMPQVFFSVEVRQQHSLQV